MNSLLFVIAILAPPHDGGLPRRVADPYSERSVAASCPAANSDALRAVSKYLIVGGYALSRAKVGLTTADTLAIQLLADPADASACATLAQYSFSQPPNSGVAPTTWTFYRIRNLIVGVALHPAANGTVHIGPINLVIFDANLNILDHVMV